jgi:hypothetical protein
MLDARQLIETAEAATGLSDWGEPEFGSALAHLCSSANADPSTDATKMAGFAAQLSHHLVTRLRLYADRATYSVIPEQAIIAPLFVVGFPRSGTTILHGLLAADPRARSPLAWELAAPSPPPRAETALTDARIAVSQAAIDELPAPFRAMHAMGAMLPDEDNSIMQLAFRSLNFAASRPLPAYVEWLLDCDMAPAFAFHRHILQHLQAFNPRDWWVLKAPPHLFCFDALFAAYPDARVVFTHRDPVPIMASNSSLIAYLHEMMGNVVDRHALGQAENAKWRKGMARAMAFRAAHPELAKRFYDMPFDALVGDAVGGVEQVYAHFNIAFPDEVRSVMQQFMADNGSGKHGAHRYTPEEYGMTSASVRAEFADYLTAFAITLEGAKP